ncbi:MAG: ATP-binding protein, partial [Dehalococcoidia bacterium]
MPPEASASPGNLPNALTGFVGRAAELAACRALFSDPRHRLVTVTGAGGCGKTRLALAAAPMIAGSFPDGIWLVELASLAQSAFLPQAVAAALQVREAAGEDLLTTLCEVLRDRRLLLILDNCEHLLDACALLVEGLLRRCGGVRVLATSRDPLKLAGEFVYPLAPLAVPDVGIREPEALHGCDAVGLFVERAVAVQPRFALTSENAGAVAQICRRLDGLPLALELAAARLTALTAHEIAARLDDRFQLLTAGYRTAPPRHQTLRAVLDWSYDLLEPAQRALFCRLAVFAGGFDLEAVAATEAVGPPPLPAAPLDLLSRLVEQSLVVMDEFDGEARYRLLETIRAYASERLQAQAEREAAEQAHAAYFLALARRALKHLGGPEQAVWLNRLEREHDNLRAVLASTGDGSAVGLELAGTLWPFWHMRGYLSEGRGWLARVLAMPDAESPPARARALNGAGALAQAQGAYAEGEQYFSESLALQRELADPHGTAAVLSNLGIIARLQGEYARAVSLNSEAVHLFRQQGDQLNIAKALNNLGSAALDLGDAELAERSHAESLALRRALQDQRGVALSLANLGEVARFQARWADARLAFEEAAPLLRSLGNRAALAVVLVSLGQTMVQT